MAVNRYFSTLVAELGDCWNQFWFRPIDRRPLDLLRVIVGCVSLYLLVTLLPDLNFYFGENGLLPVEAVDQVSTDALNRNQRGWSYLDYFQSSNELLMLQVAGIAIVGLFTFGLWTAITAPLSLVVMLSITNRAPMLTSQVEPVVTMVLFYWCLGPGGPFAAIVAGANGQPVERESSWSTVSLRLIQVHIVLLYFAMGLSKLMGEAWWTGTGVWWLMARPESRLFDVTGMAKWELGANGTPIGIYLVNFWTHLVVAFEIGFAILIWNRMLRPLLLGWSVIHWLGVGVLLGQPLLAVTMIAVNAAFLDGPRNARAAA